MFSSRVTFAVIAIVAVLAGAASAQSQAPVAAPPQFLTIPILTRVSEAGLEHGHFVFGADAAIPAPLVSNQGSTPFVSATFSAALGITASDLNVSNLPDSYEGETGAAHFGSLLIVAGSNHIYPGNCDKSAAPGAFGDCAPRAYVSASGGLGTWTSTALPRTWNGTTLGIGFDPSIDYDKNGNFYFVYGVAPLSKNYPNGVVAVKSTDGSSWTQLPTITFNQGKAFDDKYYAAVDRSSSAFANRIYVSWDRNQGFNQILYVAYSGDGGSTWSAPIKVNDGTTSHERVIGAYPAVDHNTGVVYDSWHDYAKNIIFVDKSINGGVNCGTDVAAATTHAGFGQDIGCVGGERKARRTT
jgi:hypothetical protein